MTETEIERLVIRLIGDSSSYEAMMKKAESAISGMLNDVTKFQGPLNVVDSLIKTCMGSFSQWGSMLLQGLGIASFTLLTREAISLSAELENVTISFETMLGSANRAKTMLKEIQIYAMATPFEQGPLRQSAQMLMNYGIAADKIIPTLRMLGDVSAGDQNKLNGLAYAFAQMSARGKVAGDDLRQMINWGFNPLQEMSRTSGKSMGELTEKMHRGEITIKMLTDAFKSATAEGGRFYGMMDKQAKSLTGLWSTFKDEVSLILTEIGNLLVEKLDIKTILQASISAMQDLSKFMKEYGNYVVTATIVMAAFVAGMAIAQAAIVAYTLAKKVQIAAEIFALSLQGPKGWAIIAAGAAVAGAAILAMSGTLSYMAGKVKEVQEEEKELAKVEGIKKLKYTTEEAAAEIVKLSDELQKLGAYSNTFGDEWTQIVEDVSKKFVEFDLRKVLGIDEFGKAAEEASPRLIMLRQAMAELMRLQDTLPAHQFDQAFRTISQGIDQELNASMSRFTDKLESQKHRIRELQAEINPKDAREIMHGFGSGSSMQFADESMNLAQDIKALEDVKEMIADAEKNVARLKSEARDAAKAMTEAMMPDSQRVEEELRKIDSLFGEGLISATTRDRAIEKSQQAFEKMLPDAEQVRRQLKRDARAIDEAFRDGFIDESTRNAAMTRIANDASKGFEKFMPKPEQIKRQLDRDVREIKEAFDAGFIDANSRDLSLTAAFQKAQGAHAYTPLESTLSNSKEAYARIEQYKSGANVDPMIALQVEQTKAVTAGNETLTSINEKLEQIRLLNEVISAQEPVEFNSAGLATV